MKNQKIELIFRCLSVFLSIYFTISWGEKNNLQNDIPFILFAAHAALAVHYMR